MRARLLAMYTCRHLKAVDVVPAGEGCFGHSGSVCLSGEWGVGPSVKGCQKELDRSLSPSEAVGYRQVGLGSNGQDWPKLN